MKSSLISFSLAYAFAKVREFPSLAHPVHPLTQPRPAREAGQKHLEVAGLNTSAKDGFAMVTDPEGIAAQRYRDFVEEMLGRSWPRKRMLVTSPGSGEGKTLTAVNLALALAERGTTVFLAELTLTRPRYRYVFGAPDTLQGIESVLQGEATPEETSLQLGETRIAVGSVAKPMPNNDLLQGNPHLQGLLEYAESNCDWTVLDTPSVEGSAAVKELAGQAGPVVMVARSLQTKLEGFRAAAATLGSDLDYVILNDVA